MSVRLVSHIERFAYGWMLVCAFSATSHHARVASLPPGSCDPLDVLDAICRAKVSERAVVDGSQAPVSTQQASEQGYLNLTSPLVLPDPAGTK